MLPHSLSSARKKRRSNFRPGVRRPTTLSKPTKDAASSPRKKEASNTSSRGGPASSDGNNAKNASLETASATENALSEKALSSTSDKDAGGLRGSSEITNEKNPVDKSRENLQRTSDDKVAVTSASTKETEEERPSVTTSPTSHRASLEEKNLLNRRMVGVGIRVVGGKIQRKKKKVGVAIGSSRPSFQKKQQSSTASVHERNGSSERPTSSSQKQLDAVAVATSTGARPAGGFPNNAQARTAAAATAVAAAAPIIPEADPSIPRLSAFCSRFKQERRKRKCKEDRVDGEASASASAATGGNHRSRKKKNTGPSSARGDGWGGAAAEESASSSGPRVQIIDGEIVLQESSLVVVGAGTSSSRTRATAEEEEEMTVVEEEAQLAVVGASYHSFVDRQRPVQWTVEDTAKFYDALRQVGTDFDTMEVFFSGEKKPRTRRQLTRKYQAEIAKNPQLVEQALNPAVRKQVDLSVFKVTDDDLPPPRSKREEEGAAAANQQSMDDNHQPATKKDANDDSTRDDTNNSETNGASQDDPQRSPLLVLEEDQQQEEEEEEHQQRHRQSILAPASLEEEETPLWPDDLRDDDACFGENNDHPEGEEDLMMKDPLLEEEDDELHGSPAAATALSLVGTTTVAKTSKSKKPKFRSKRRPKAK